jgi:signal transduction histidine kinase
MLNHELMHPVSAIRGLALALQRGWDRRDDSTTSRAIDGLLHQSAQLRELAERAPDLSELRLDSTVNATETWSVEEVLRNVQRTFADVGDRLEIPIKSPGDRCAIEVDMSRVMQVFHNLLSNAVKYSPEGTPIVIEASQHDGDVVFSVTDAGPGIRPDDAVRLFEPFARLEAARGAEGSGLGLYISRLIIEAHGGSIWVDRAPGGGCSVSFSVPASRASTP